MTPNMTVGAEATGPAGRWVRRGLLGAAAWPLGLLAACAQGATDSSVSSATKKPVKITYMNISAGGAQRAEADERQIRLFSEQHPHITVQIDRAAAGFPDLKQKLIVTASAGTPPSYSQNGWGVWTDLARKGVVREISSYFKAAKLSPEALFIPAAVDQHSFRDVLYALPATVSADALPYNKDLFDRAGLPYPPSDPMDRTWTMEKFLDVCQKLTKSGEQVGMGNTHSRFAFNRGTWFGQIAWDDKKRQAFVNHPNHIKGHQFWVDLIHRYRVLPTADEARPLVAGASNVFAAGKAAFFYSSGPARLATVPFKWGIAALPYSGPAGTKNISGRIYPNSLVMVKEQPKDEAEAVWTLFRWYASKPENGGQLVVSGAHLVSPFKDPAFSALALQEFAKTTGGVDGKAYVLQAQNSYPSSCGLEKYEEYDEVWTKILDSWNKAEANQITTTEFANLAQKAFDEAKVGGKGV